MSISGVGEKLPSDLISNLFSLAGKHLKIENIEKKKSLATLRYCTGIALLGSHWRAILCSVYAFAIAPRFTTFNQRQRGILSRKYSKLALYKYVAISNNAHPIFISCHRSQADDQP